MPGPEDNTWLLVLIDLLTMETLTAADPFFDTFLKRLPQFSEKILSSTLYNAKDTTMNIIGLSTTLAKVLSLLTIRNGMSRSRTPSRTA